MAVRIIDQALRRAKLQKALLLYGADENNIEFATAHDVDHSSTGQPVIRAGRPVDRKSLVEVARSLSISNLHSVGLLPPNVLSVGPEFLVWWIPPRSRSIFFNADRQEPEQVSIGKRSAVVPYPGLIFAVREQSCYVYAVKGEERPSAQTEVYRSPFFNVWEAGKVCTGNVKLPNAVVTERIAAWEESFFYSNFTHPNVTRLVKYPGGSYPFWNDMLDGKFERFPERVLLPMQLGKVKKGNKQSMTVADLVAHFEGNKE